MWAYQGLVGYLVGLGGGCAVTVLLMKLRILLAYATTFSVCLFQVRSDNREIMQSVYQQTYPVPDRHWYYIFIFFPKHFTK